MGLKYQNIISSVNGNAACQLNGKLGHAYTMVINTISWLVDVGCDVFFNLEGDSRNTTLTCSNGFALILHI